MLTIAREIELFWQRPKKSWAFVLFVANRYISILGHASGGVYSFWSPEIQSDYSVEFLVKSCSIPYLTCNHPFSETSGKPILIYFVVVFGFTAPHQVWFHTLLYRTGDRSRSDYRIKYVLTRVSIFIVVMNPSRHDYACLRSSSTKPVSFNSTSGALVWCSCCWLCTSLRWKTVSDD